MIRGMFKKNYYINPLKNTDYVFEYCSGLLSKISMVFNVIDVCHFYRSSIYRQSPVKNQPINHKVDNFHVLTKVPHNTRET